MIRHGYHSYRGPAYRGQSLDPSGYGVGVELETDCHHGDLFASARAVRGVRPERDGSLDYTTGVEFVFAATDNLRLLASRFTAVKERTAFGTRDSRNMYGCHININAQNKSSMWRRLMFLSGSVMSYNTLFLRQIGRRTGYSDFATSSATWGASGTWSTTSPNYLMCAGISPGSNGPKTAIALRPNRIEFRIFKTCDNLETLMLYVLFSQLWSEWISDLERTQYSTVADAIAAVSYHNFIEWLRAKPSDNAAATAVLNLSTAAHRLATEYSLQPYMPEDSYIRAAGEPINAICRSLLAPQRRGRRASPFTTVLPQGQAVPSLSPA